MDVYTPDQFNIRNEMPPTRRWRYLVVALAVTLAIFGGRWLASLGEISVNSSEENLWQRVANLFPLSEARPVDTLYVMPEEEQRRLDVLILGVRGEDDIENGGLLTDTIMLFSFDRDTKKASLVSVPRDLYVRINDRTYDKVNSAYERLGIKSTEKLFSQIAGVYVDYAVVFDFRAFQTVIDELGGIDIVLDKPFKETTQWGYEFSLPAGPNHLNGQDALYYVRSRFSTSDFDRARRQQQVILAIQKKLQTINFLKEPIRTINLVSAIKKNIKTDVNILDVQPLLSLGRDISGQTGTIRRGVLSTDNLLYETSITGSYRLLPQGDNFDLIKTYFKEILI